ncbi:hypothetical protein FIBSPDRAFT_902046 [Athelia psychrophila]|uniref:Uncharacterized protein n=1 Tax=Athelia psychrophila TaxID=1759441 RepID=A0A167XQN2_9AGAM|nr:hypothetical protein FIBSPDRAFT_902046 [Fibularhizoctonia sp. CBS 109695]
MPYIANGVLAGTSGPFRRWLYMQLLQPLDISKSQSCPSMLQSHLSLLHRNYYQLLNLSCIPQSTTHHSISEYILTLAYCIAAIVYFSIYHAFPIYHAFLNLHRINADSSPELLHRSYHAFLNVSYYEAVVDQNIFMPSSYIASSQIAPLSLLHRSYYALLNVSYYQAGVGQQISGQ